MSGLAFGLRYRRMLAALAAVGLVATAGSAAQAATIKYQFDNFTATGPWATYGYTETLYWFQYLGGTPSFQLNTATNAVTSFDFSVNPEYGINGNTNDYNGVNNGNAPINYNPATFTLDYQGPYNHYYLKFSSDLDNPGPATLVRVDVPNAGDGISHFSTAVTGGVSVAAVFDVPEPMSAALLGVGLIGVGAFRRQRRSETCQPA